LRGGGWKGPVCGHEGCEKWGQLRNPGGTLKRANNCYLGGGKVEKEKRNNRPGCDVEKQKITEVRERFTAKKKYQKEKAHKKDNANKQ